MWFFDFIYPSYQFWNEIRKICQVKKIPITYNYILTLADYNTIRNYLQNLYIKSPVLKDIYYTSLLYADSNSTDLLVKQYRWNITAKDFAMCCYVESLWKNWAISLNPKKDDEIFRKIFWY